VTMAGSTVMLAKSLTSSIEAWCWIRHHRIGDRREAGDWRVEYFDDDGGCYVTVFENARGTALAPIIEQARAELPAVKQSILLTDHGALFDGADLGDLRETIPDDVVTGGRRTMSATRAAFHRSGRQVRALSEADVRLRSKQRGRQLRRPRVVHGFTPPPLPSQQQETWDIRAIRSLSRFWIASSPRRRSSR
jgi:hypothetical protein